MENDDTLIHLHPQTDYEKLLFAERYIKELKQSLSLCRIEKGKLQSELDEAKVENIKLNAYKKISKDVRREIKKEELYKLQAKHIHDLTIKNHRLRKDNWDLIFKLNTKINLPQINHPEVPQSIDNQGDQNEGVQQAPDAGSDDRSREYHPKYPKDNLNDDDCYD